jgi:hypothetical protein
MPLMIRLFKLRRRTKSEDARIVAVDPERPMTPQELAKRRRECSMLHDSMVKREHRRVWKDCAMLWRWRGR